mgnify:CR=1 FL=1
MDNKLKTYHFKKLNYYIKRTNLIFFCFINNLNNEDQLTLNQKLFKSNIEIYKIKKTLTQKIIKNSIFSNSSIICEFFWKQGIERVKWVFIVKTIVHFYSH